MAYTPDQLQAIINQINSDVAKFKQVINGDVSTIVTLSDGTVLPSIQKLINDGLNAAAVAIYGSVKDSLNHVADNLYKDMFTLDNYVLTITPTNAGTTIQITLDNLVAVQKLMINGLEEPDDGTVYSVSGQTITLFANDALSPNDTIIVTYYSNN